MSCLVLNIYLQGFPVETELDTYDTKPDTAHILLKLLDGPPIGTIRCARIGTGFKLGRLAVLKDYRSFKFGAKLVLALYDYARAKAKSEKLDRVVIICHSQLPVIPFYLKYGYKAEVNNITPYNVPRSLHSDITHAG